eukprot:3374671-Pleurochrysis_carterae.AAC.2
MSLRAGGPKRAQSTEDTGTTWSTTSPRTRDGADTAESFAGPRCRNHEAQPVAREITAASIAVPNDQPQEPSLSDELPPSRLRSSLSSIAELSP